MEAITLKILKVLIIIAVLQQYQWVGWYNLLVSRDRFQKESGDEVDSGIEKTYF